MLALRDYALEFSLLLMKLSVIAHRAFTVMGYGDLLVIWLLRHFYVLSLYHRGGGTYRPFVPLKLIISSILRLL